MTLLEIIRQRYPDAEPGQFEIVQDGTEIRLERWDVRDDGAFTARPDEAQLRAWIDEQEQRQLREMAQEHSLQKAAAAINRPATGVHWAQLTPAMKDRLLIALLYHAGAVAPNGRVRPVEQWHGLEEVGQ